MIDHAAIFEATIRAISRGQYGRFDTNRLPPLSWERGALEFQIGQTRHNIPKVLAMKGVIKPLAGIHFDLVDDPHLNACAFVINDFGYVGMEWGSVFVLHDLFYRMFSHPEVWPKVGDPGKESVTPFHAEPLTDDCDVILSRRPKGPGGGILAALPKCPIRRACAEHLAIVALFFLVEHEFGHIRAGHCEYLDSVGLPFASEIKLRNSTKGDKKLIRQALEYEADLFAAEMTLGSALRWERRPGSGPPTPEARLTLWRFAVLSLFWILGFDFDAQQFDAEDYPHPAVRVMAIESFIERRDARPPLPRTA